MSTHLVIGDAHAKPGVSNDRFTWLGKLALDRKPDYIIDMGDWADMPSLSSYDKGRKSFEGRRYKHDIAASVDAYRKFDAPIAKYNKNRANNHKTQYKPKKIKLIGNHEERILRAQEASPELEGVINLEDVGYDQFGWKASPFLHPIPIDGVYYNHYFTSGILGRPIGGDNPAAVTLRKQFVSCTSAHTHIRDFAERTRADGQRILGLVAGCFFEHHEAYAGPANDMWWRGVIICHNVKDGYYDPEFISLSEVKRRYG